MRQRIFTIEALEQRIAPAVFFVTNNSDSGPGSFRQAILNANEAGNEGEPDEIRFRIDGFGVQTIRPLTPLPTITDPVIIDGYSQAGSFPNTQAVGSDARLMIELDGSLTPNETNDDGLRITGGGSTVRGLIINRFHSYAIEISEGGGNTIEGNWVGPNQDGLTASASSTFGILISNSSNNLIGGASPGSRNVVAGNVESLEIIGNGSSTSSENNRILGNYFGVGKDGTTPLGNEFAIYTQGPRTFIGGPNPGEGNVISNTVRDAGIYVNTSFAIGTVIQGNIIGLDAMGTVAMGNGDYGIIADTPDLTIGGNTAGARNIISSNTGGGMVLNGTNAIVRGNYIGTDITGTLAMPNVGHGIELAYGTVADVAGTIGGIAAGEGNLIAFNTLDGVSVSVTSGTSAVSIRGNSIHSNGGLGIDLGDDGVTSNDTGDTDSGANGLQNFPVLTSATRSGTFGNVSGTFQGVSMKNYFIDFYASTSADSTGYGEGRIFLGDIGVTTDTSGVATFNFNPSSLPAPGSWITAVITDGTGASSEFSAAILLSTEFFWDGSAEDQDWYTPANWTPEGVPGALDRVTLNIPAIINLPSSTSVASFTQTDGIFTSPEAVTLTVLESFTWSGGTHGGAGITTIVSTGQLVLNGVDKTLNGRTLEIFSNTRLSGEGDIYLASGATINNHGLFEVESDADFIYSDYESASVAFNNLTGATFRKIISTDLTEFTGYGLTFNSSGVVDVRTGTLRLGSSGTGTDGDFDIASGATLEFSGGTHDLLGTTTLRGGGVFTVDGATVTLEDGTIYGIGTTFELSWGFLTVFGTLTLAPESVFTQNGGTLNGEGTFEVQGTFEWIYGDQEGGGRTRIASGGNLTISGPEDVFLGRRDLEVIGSATMTGNGGIVISNEGRITNYGVFDVRSDADFSYPEDDGNFVAFANQPGAIFRKSGGSGVTDFSGSNLSFTNAGLVEVETGTLSFTSAYSQSAGTLALRGGAVTSVAPLLLNGGKLIGVGSIGGDVENNGAVVRPGETDSTGSLNISGNYLQGPAGSVAVDLAGTSPGEFDVLSITGIATLGGTLEISLISGFTPVPGSQFRVISSSNNPGTFASLSGQVEGLSQTADSAGLVLEAIFVGSPDLVVLSSNGLTAVSPGSVLTYNLTYRNDGVRNATGVILTEVLPAGTIFNSGASTPGWSEIEPGVFRLYIGSLPAGSPEGSVTFSVTVNSVAAAGLHDISNTVSISNDGENGPDETYENNNALESDSLNAAPDLSISVATDNSVARRGSTITYSLGYINIGNQDATGALLIQSVPANATFLASSSTAGWTETAPGSGFYQLLVGDLAAGEEGTVTFAVRFASNLGNSKETVASSTVTDDLTNGPDPTPLDNQAESRATVYQGVYILAPGVPVNLKNAAPPTVRVFDINTGTEAFRFDAYESDYRDSVRIAVGDLNGDGIDDIITAKRTGTGQVRVFDGLTGTQLTGPTGQIDPFDGLKRSTQGAFVASGDVTGDQRDDIIVGSALGGGTVKIYDGVTGALVNTYQPFGAKFKGGVRVAAGDLDGDGTEDVIVSQGSNGSRVKAYDSSSATAMHDFRAGPKGYRGGIFVATGDFNGDGHADIVTGRDIGGAPRIEVFSGIDLDRISSFLAFNSKFKNGVRVAAADVNLDGIADIIATSGTGNRSQVRVFDGSNSDLVLSFAAFPDFPDNSLFVASSTTLPTGM